MNVSIREVTTKRDLRAFVHFPNELYKDNPYYVTQIESMDRDTLNPAKNHAFEVCEGKYWLAYDEKDEIVGRAADLVARKYELRQAPLKKRSDVGPYLDGVFKCLNAACSRSDSSIC